jgi:putative pyridoxal-dependent aspartate 1-decarboxylase
LQVQPGQNIVVSLLHDHHLMAVLLAVKKIGAVYVPVDPQTPQDRIVYIQELSESIAIIDYKLLEEIKQYAVTLETIPTTWNRTSENDIEFIIYTSGSTGKPKGVLIKTKSVNNRLHWMWKNYAFQTGEVCCAKTSISFVDHIWEFFGPLLKGIPLVFYRKTEIIDIPNFIHSLSKENISRIVLVPTLLRAMLNHPELCREKLSKLNIWISSGEALKRRDVDAFYNTMSRSNVRLLNIYGSTEVTADATYYDTYADYNQRKSFQLFDHSLKDEVEALIDIQDVNLNIIANSLEEILQDGDFNSVEFDEKGSSEAYVELLQQKILPNVVNVGSPNYIGHMTGPVPKFIREMNALVTVLNQNQVKIETSLISTLIENQVIGAFHHLVYQKEKAFYETYVQDPASPLGVITNGGTMSNIMALSYALNNALKPKGRFRGLAEEGLVKALKFYDYENVVLLGSPWCHYSFGKALKMLGLGKESFIKVDYEGKDHTAIKDELRTIINRLKSEKTLVLGLIGIAGITESGNIDPLVTLGEIAKEHQIHFHVDAAFGGSFLMDDELRKKFKGIQLADSISICAHKQLYIPIGLSVCLFGDPDFATASENNTHYQARKGSFDLGKYTVEGSRNFMSLILHAALHVFGKEGFAEVVRHNYQTAQHFASLIESSSEFELLYRPDLNIVLYRYIPIAMRGKTQFTDEELEQVNTLNRAIQKQQFHGGNTFVSYTEIYRQGNATRHVAFRTVFMNPYTGPQNLINVLEDQKAIAAKLEGRDEYIPAGAKNENVPIGKPIENVKVYILDEFLNMLPIGVTGEICISGDCISAGYVNVSEQNTQKFIENPFEKGQRLFRTGDLGRRLPDGNIEFVARKDDQVKIRGHRIELGEVEHALLKNEDISEAVVVAKELEPNEVKLIAYLISDKKQQVGSVRNQLKEWLPDYMLPSYVVQLESFPLTSSGKINKKELPNPEKINLLDMETYVPPTNEQERNIVAIWERVLKREHIGMQDDFFALGGHSLKATYLINEYQKDFGVKLELNDIFVNSTVGSHLALLRKAPKVSYTTIPKVPKQQHYAISDAQKRLWVLSQFANSSTAYNMPFSLELKGAIDVSLFQRALIATMDRHEILRTVFREDETGEIRQWIIPEEANQFKLNYLDFSKETEQKSKAKAYISEDSYAAFNLSTGPLLRATLIRLEEEKFVFYYNMHHIISDGVSLEVLKRDVLAFYEAYLKDSTPDIPVLNIQYKDYAAWQLERFNSTAFQEHQQFWLEKLAGKLPVLKFPGEKQRPAIKTYTGNSLVTHISKELCSALKAYCLQQESSVFIGALAVWKIVFHKYTGQSDMMVGTPVAGRDHEELKEQIGCYFNTLLLRNQIQSEATFTETFAQVKQSVLDSFAHKEYPFDKIIEDLNLKRDMSRNPAFDIMFSFHNTGENTLDINIENVDEIVDKGAVHSKLDLLINFAEHGAYFYIDIDYNTNIFQSEFIKELLHNYKRVLQEVLAHPDKPLKELSLQRATVKKKAMSHQKLKKLLK